MAIPGSFKFILFLILCFLLRRFILDYVFWTISSKYMLFHWSMYYTLCILNHVFWTNWNHIFWTAQFIECFLHQSIFLDFGLMFSLFLVFCSKENLLCILHQFIRSQFNVFCTRNLYISPDCILGYFFMSIIYFGLRENVVFCTWLWAGRILHYFVTVYFGLAFKGVTFWTNVFFIVCFLN